ncbi:LysR family transcriptional regulator [Companilactobacillus insicii]|uniref:LysR family transcriptional regulator n=1 Tax=Companilactobacillus insicii TaxID=1732567 RepID=UPI000F79B01D|nr:LysR family transcriptional regulator [Companilactobacillus insicii]
MIKIRLLQLKYFLEVANTQNISQAARILRISQPSLSRSIKELEDELGIPLFNRNGRALELNSMGKSFQKNIKGALKQIDNAVNLVQGLAEQKKHNITLRFESSSPLIPEIIHRIKQSLPKSNIELIQHGVENSNLEHYDFEFSTHPITGNINRLLITEEILLAVNKNSDLAKSDSVRIEQLQKLKFVMTDKTPLQSLIDTFLRENNINIRSPFITGDRATMHGLIVENAGSGLVPQYSWLNYDNQNIGLLHLSPKRLYRKIYLSYYPKVVNDSYHKLVEQIIYEYFRNISET